ncbi:NAD(P)/FAD-dependent oxidoreductase [Streptomyces oryzae]|uniref:NAD(P)/FAD-dependent oxidoreductase n=1 Tax=Streptomyces oryzae TaxID=1434886 RepID=A0ABS3XA09_9ACTN|nr:NAD(P)/FAD-dependent oxidoreductase [Streptomyces oryzae]
MEAELVVVGGGPAGVAAVLMAGSLGLRTVLVEADRVGGKVWEIGALENVPGGRTEGVALAEALVTDVARLQEAGRCSVVGARAVRVRGHEDRAETVLDDGRTLAASAVVVATGVTALTPGDVPWIDAPEALRPPPLWRASPEDVGRGSPAVVLGADRPLGTWLRAHPDAAVRLDVLHPPGDAYKTAEVAADARVRLHEVDHVTLSPHEGGWRVVARRTDGATHEVTAHALFGNIGSAPAPLDGDLVPGPDGYCPPAAQHPRVLVAGDLRSARHQRIVTAEGSGAEAVLTHYYAARGLAGSLHRQGSQEQ